MNEELLVSSVRQHELTERAENATQQAEDALEETKVAQAALRLSEEQFRAAIKEAPIPVIMHAEDGEVLQISRSWTELTGYTIEDQGVMKEWLNTAYGYGGEQVSEAMRNAFLPLEDGEGPMRAVLFDITTRSGEKRTWSFNASTPGSLSDGRRYVVGMAEDITDRVRTEEALRASETSLAKSQMRLAMELSATQQLQKVSTQLIAEDDPEALYEKILDAAVAIMRSQYASIQMFHPERGEGGELRLLAHRGFGAEAAEHWKWVRPASESTCGVALRTGKRVIVTNVEADEQMAGSEDLAVLISTGIRAVQTTPLLSRNGRMLGMISTHWHQPHNPAERDLRLLDVLSRQASDLIERLQSEEKLRESEDRQAFLLRLSDVLRPLSDPVAVQGETARLLREHFDVGWCFYAEFDDDDQTAVILKDAVREGLPSLAGRHDMSDIPEYVEAIRTGRMLNVPDFANCELLSPRVVERYTPIGVRTMLGIALVKAGRLVSQLVMHDTAPREWPREAEEILREVAERTWAAVERTQAEQALARSEENYRNLFNSIDEGFCVVEILLDESGRPRDYRFLEMNPLFEELTGLENALGKTALELVPGLEKFWIETYGNVAITGEPVRFENYAEPMKRWFNVHASRVGEPELRHVAIVFTNITSRKLAEEALRESEERLQLAQDAGNVGIWDWDIPAGRTFWSETMWRMYGVEPRGSGPDRKTWPEHIHPDDRAGVKMKLNGTISSGETDFRDVFRIVRPDGEVRWIESIARVSRDEQGNAARMFGVNLDITNRKKIENRLRANEERVRLLTESFEDYAIFSTDTEGLVRTWNPGAEKIFGFSEEEIIDTSAKKLFTPEDRAQGIPENEMKTAWLEGRASDERWHIRKDNSRFFASGVMAPLHEGDELVGYAKIARDLTARKQMEDALRESREQLEIRVFERTRELAEANEQLQLESLDRLHAEEERVALLRKIVTTQEDERRRIARDMHDQLGQRMTALRLKIAATKDLSVPNTELRRRIDRIEEIGAGVDEEISFLAWELRPAGLDELGLVAAMENFSREWSRHCEIGAEFHSSGFGRHRLVPEVETNLYRILQEALNNISKHSKATSVSIMLEKRKSDIVLIVEDNGAGFDIPDKTNVKRSNGGLGILGMRERAAIVGGEIDIESTVGKGTTIYARVAAKFVR